MTVTHTVTTVTGHVSCNSLNSSLVLSLSLSSLAAIIVLMFAGIRHKAVLVLGLVMVTLACSCLTSADEAFNRGVDYREQGDHENAIEAFDAAIRLDPQYALAYYNRGWTYIKMGQYEEAIQDFDEAIRLGPQYADLYNNRGIAYELLGKQELADRDYAKAKELGFRQ